MSDDGFERFEITDYDLDNEFNPNRPRRKLSKKQQIYGIFADDSDNDDYHLSRGRRNNRGGNAKDYTAPVSFVAGGVQQSGKKNKNVEEPEDDQISDDEYERPTFGNKSGQLMGTANSSNESSDGEIYASQVLKKNYERKSTGRVGAWEQHTRGIGAKLLLQMGYEPGKGLGKDLQGISQPVEAFVRKGRGAIGAYGPEMKTSVSERPESIKNENVRESKHNKQKINKWKKGTDGGHRNQNYHCFKTAEEIIERGKNSKNNMPDKLSKQLGNVPVIDMTGPERRVLSGYHALAHTRVMDEDIYEVKTDLKNKLASQASNVFDMPELKHNLQLIVDLCEQQIIATHTSLRTAADNESYYEYQLKSLREIMEREYNYISTLENVSSLVYELVIDDSDLTIERTEHLFIKLQQVFGTEYKEFKLADLAAGVVGPLLKRHLDAWQPLEQPTQYIDLIKKWSTILEVKDENEVLARNIFDPYSSIIWVGVIPSFRACAGNWNPKQYQPMAALLDAWAPLFPSWILDSVLEQLVLPRLTRSIREWDPLTDTVPIHIWILPWHNVLGFRMEESVYPTIREKLGFALHGWMPHDRSARAMLLPWKGVFNVSEMQEFLVKHIVPKLQMVLSELIINPLDQKLDMWYTVWEWYEVLPLKVMTQLLEKSFFPKWMQMLIIWLNQSPNYIEVTRWYAGWKSMFPAEFLNEPNIKDIFRRALEVMHRATDNTDKLTSFESKSAQPPAQAPPPPALMDIQITKPIQLEFKQVVSQKCAELGILFAPLPGRRELGKQIYRVGKLYCYIDRNICMISENTQSSWRPIGLSQMLDRAMTGVIN
ncbi:septin-interacting protein 1-like [Teleopsis dalmanni]|uniref:septin-interacting protein 1-like n=1 Tax=Teleopsis dalmanni TaxID=139649 RepID=UPI0018CDE14F|nr:septin-interacting protein 1-like [Teleopsis dalmanni]